MRRALVVGVFGAIAVLSLACGSGELDPFEALRPPARHPPEACAAVSRDETESHIPVSYTHLTLPTILRV